MPTAVDRTIFRETEDDNRHVDLVYVGGKWPYKGINIDSYLIPVLERARQSGLDFRVFGWGEWSADICSGIVPDDEINGLFNSAKIGPCISEPHTHRWGFDLPERLWKISACGVLPIHDPVPTLRSILPDLPMAKCAGSYMELVFHYLEDEPARINLSRKLQREIVTKHSYHNRISRLFADIGWKSESELMLEW
jgi:spore maturation protein CgeB